MEATAGLIQELAHKDAARKLDKNGCCKNHDQHVGWHAALEGRKRGYLH